MSINVLGMGSMNGEWSQVVEIGGGSLLLVGGGVSVPGGHYDLCLLLRLLYRHGRGV
jgi:hypothetical protein